MGLGVCGLWELRVQGNGWGALQGLDCLGLGFCRFGCGLCFRGYCVKEVSGRSVLCSGFKFLWSQCQDEEGSRRHPRRLDLDKGLGILLG